MLPLVWDDCMAVVAKLWSILYHFSYGSHSFLRSDLHHQLSAWPCCYDALLSYILLIWWCACIYIIFFCLFSDVSSAWPADSVGKSYSLQIEIIDHSGRRIVYMKPQTLFKMRYKQELHHKHSSPLVYADPHYSPHYRWSHITVCNEQPLQRNWHQSEIDNRYGEMDNCSSEMSNCFECILMVWKKKPLRWS